jgi:hypothetical protein
VIAVLKNAYNPAGASLGAGSADAILSLRTMPTIASRISRASYGVVFGNRVNSVVPPVDRAKEEVYKDIEGIERVDRMAWYLKKVTLLPIYPQKGRPS